MIENIQKPIRTGIVRDEIYLKHVPAHGHPENEHRLEVIYRMIRAEDMNGHFIDIVPRCATKEEILLVHSPEHYDNIAGTDGLEQCRLTADTLTCPDSFKAALTAVGGLFESISAVVSGKLSNAFAMVRPPGHHAEKGRAMGFCLFNNVALGAMFARKVLGLRRVLIVDWDVHHGNGTQHCFESDPSVMFFSIHQYPLFPGTGLYTEAGIGAGEGYTINIPLSKGYGDGEYIGLFEQLLKPVARAFAPELIIVSAGFDIHQSDPIGKMRVSTRGFAGLTRSLMNIADTCCDGKLVLCLEGGYNLNVLEQSVKAVLQELSGMTVTDMEALCAKMSRKKLNYVLKRVIHVHKRFWKCL